MYKDKKQIIEAALSLFNQKGIDSTSVNDIILFSKVSRTVFEEHFESKKDLIFEIYSEGKKEMYRFVYGELLDEEDYKVFIKKVFYQATIWGVNHPELYSFMTQIQIHPLQWGEEHEIYIIVNESIIDKTEKALRNGVIKDLPINFIIHFMSGMQASCITYIHSLKVMTSEEYEPLMEPMFEVCWDAIKATDEK